MSETTFGCGAFLPGRGPFNFPDFIEGGNVNDPDPPDPDPPGTKTEADPTDPPVVVDPGGDGPFTPIGGGPSAPAPSSPGGGGGPFTPIGGQPPAPGPSVPSTPGPQVPGAPTAPPTPKECRCVINENRISVNFNVRFDGTQVWNITFNQKCVRQPIGTPNTTQAVIDNFIATLPLGGQLSIEGTGFGNENCNTGTTTAPRCNGGCPAISARYSIPAIPDPPAPGPTINPGEGAPQPGPINPQPKPTGGGGPFTPIGGGPSAPAPSNPGGGNGGGGVVSAGPQSPGPGPVRPGITNAGPQNPIEPISPGGGGNGYTPLDDLPSAPPPSVPGGGNGGGGPSSAGPQGPAPPQVPFDPGGNTGGGGDPIGTLPEADPTGGFNFVGGGVIGRSSGNTIKNITNALETTSSIDLGDPEISREILAQRPSGFEEEEIFFDDTPEKSVFVENTSNITDIFARVIDNNIPYLLQNQSTVGDWDSKRAGGVTPTTVYNSLNEETREILSRILNYDRTPINRS